MSDWTPIQFVPLEWTAIRLHQIFKECPLYSCEMTASIFLPHTNLCFLINFFYFFGLRVSLSTSTQISKRYIQNKDDWNLHRYFYRIKMPTVDHSELCLASNCCSQSYKLPTFLSDHLHKLTGRAREIHPPTRPCSQHLFWRTWAVHLA